jgi:hypothetical protein
MRGDRTQTPAATVVARVADGGRQLADYLDRHGPEGVLREVQDFARRRPGAFLGVALAAGFVVGRLGKGVTRAGAAAGTSGKPATDTYTSRYPQTGTGYQPAGSSDPAGASYVPEPGVAAAPSPTAPPTTRAATGYEGTGTAYTATGTGAPLVAEEQYPTTSREQLP